MPINCSGGEKARYRVKTTKHAKVRLAFCGNKVVEAKSLKHMAKSKKKLGSK